MGWGGMGWGGAVAAQLKVVGWPAVGAHVVRWKGLRCTGAKVWGFTNKARELHGLLQKPRLKVGERAGQRNWNRTQKAGQEQREALSEGARLAWRWCWDAAWPSVDGMGAGLMEWGRRPRSIAAAG